MARKKKRASLGILFWMAFILFVLVIFMVNRPRIQTVLENTGFVEVVSRHISGDEAPDTDDMPELNWDEEPETSEDDRPDPDPPDTSDSPDTSESSGGNADQNGSESPSADGSGTTNGSSEQPEPRERGEDEPAQESEESQDSESSRDSRDSRDSTETSGSTEGESQSDNEAAPTPSNTIELSLYYVRITDDGAFPQPVERTIEYTDRPLTQTVRTLLEGPTSEEVGDGLLDLIPDGSRLRRATIRNGVAYLDFNDAFRFNPMGVEGYRLQLQQIIYVTTQFSTVDRVQFLIEGERHEWLGGEGVYIGSPLGRSSFS